MTANRFSYVTPPGSAQRVAELWPEILAAMTRRLAHVVPAEAYQAFRARQSGQPHNAALAQLWANAYTSTIPQAFGSWSEMPRGFEIIAE